MKKIKALKEARKHTEKLYHQKNLVLSKDIDFLTSMEKFSIRACKMHRLKFSCGVAVEKILAIKAFPMFQCKFYLWEFVIVYTDLRMNTRYVEDSF